MPSQIELDDYFRRSGDNKLLNGFLVENDHGFCVWSTHEDSLVLMNVYGDGIYWNKWAETKAKETGMKTIFFATKRKPDSFCRKYGYEVKGYILERVV